MPFDKTTEMTKNPYRRLGLALSLLGAVMAPVCYLLLNSVPLAALALSFIMLGLVSAALGNSQSEVSPEASQMMLRTGVENIASLLEEMGLTSKAVYLPASANGSRAKALIPLNGDISRPTVVTALPNRLVVRYGPGSEDIGLVVTTPGTVSLDGMSLNPIGADPVNIESALSQILVGTMDLADSVSVRASGDQLTIEIVKPRLKYDNVWYYRCLGSPLASIAATVVSQALNKAVIISSEEGIGKKIKVTIEGLR